MMMSRIHEVLLGYEGSDWINEADHVIIDELTEHHLYCLTVSDLQFRARQAIRYDYYNETLNALKEQNKNLKGSWLDE